MATRALRGLPTLLVGLLTVTVIFTAYTATQAFGQNHMPADKAVASGDDLKGTSNDEKAIAVLEETMRVSSSSDLIIQVTSECSILTGLVTGDDEAPPGQDPDDAPFGDAAGSTDSAFSFGQVKFFVSIDGKRVPVASNDTFVDEEEHGDSDTDDFGEVVFCNRAYQRTVTDDADDGDDDLDEEEDFIRTRTANAFNWFALDTGAVYDSPDNGNNVLDVVLWAEFDKKPNACPNETSDDDDTNISETCAEALIGSRTMIIEPTHASNTETVDPVGSPAPTNPPSNTATPSPKGKG